MKQRKSSIRKARKHKFYKFRILLDENFPIKKFFPRTRSRFDIKHLIEDYSIRVRGISDEEVYELAKKEKRLIVTMNVDDFKGLAGKSGVTGIIGVSPHTTYDQRDKKLSALLSKSSRKELYGKYTLITG